MKIYVEKFIIVYLCIILVVSCSCFQKHIQALTTKVNELFAKKPCDDDNTRPVWKLDHDRPTVSQCNNTDSNFYLFGINWKNSKIVNNWWVIAITSILPFIILWRVQYNMRKKLQEWKKMFVQKEKAYTYSRRLTLPNLTLAKHARRESLAEATQTLPSRSRKLSQSKISQFNNANSFERNEDLLGDGKRVHIIRRRH